MLAAGLVAPGQVADAQTQEAWFQRRSAAEWARELAEATRPAQRRVAAFALGKLGPAALPQRRELLRALRDPEADVRSAAAAALGEVDADGSGVSDLRQALRDDASVAVRRAAAGALGRIGRRAVPAVDDLRAALRHADPGVRQNAAFALGELGAAAERALGDLLELLRDAEPLVRRDAAAALGQLGRLAPEEVVASLRQTAQADRDVQVRAAAAAALARLSVR